MTLDPDIHWIGPALAGAVFTAGFVQGALGFGYAIVALTMVPFLFEPQTAHIVISLSGVPVLGLAAWTTRDAADWSSVGSALVGAAVFVPIGLVLFDSMSADALMRGTGLAILLLMLPEFFKKRATIEAAQPGSQTGAAFAAGAVSGFLSGAVSIGGPPIVAFAIKQGWQPNRVKAFITRYLFITSSYKAVALGYGGFVTPRSASYAAGVCLAAIIGVAIGTAAGRRLKAEHYRRLVAVVLALISCWWLITGE